ncbi:MAG: ABC-2 family transporter protein [Erysipelothrix sp.]|nr:ABC-2 family transporter protein [Erysipelothrix sp.]
MTLRPYFAFFKAYFLVYLAYRVQVILWFFTNALEIAFAMLLWAAIYASSSATSLYGFTLVDMLLYQLLMTLTYSLTDMNPIDALLDDFNDGKIAMSLIKPVNYELQIFFQNLGANAFRNVVLLLPMLAIIIGSQLLSKAGVVISLMSILIFIVSVIMGLLINYFVKFIFSNLIFYTEASFGLWQLQAIVISLLAGGIVPLHFFPEVIGNILRLLPFAYIQYIPVMSLMGRIGANELSLALWIQLGWVIVLGLAANLVWRHSIKNMKVNGG